MTILGLAHLFFDSAIVLVAACFWSCRLTRDEEGWIYRWLLLDLLFFSQIIVVATIFGYSGLFSPSALSIGFLILFIGTVISAHKMRISILSGCSLFKKDVLDVFRGFKQQNGLEQILLIALCLVVLLSGFFAVSLDPVNYDSHHYRLPKIGHWLQENSIRQYDTSVDPQNYLGFNAELLMAWVTGHFQEGYPLARVVQWLAGVWMLVSVYIAVSFMGFDRIIRYLVLMLAISAGVVCIEFSTTQTDLVSAAFVANGFVILISAPRRLVFAGISWGISTGVKGTVYFFGPGMVFVAAAFLLKKRISRAQFTYLCVAFALSWTCFTLPRHVENVNRFGHPLASPEWMEIHSGGELEIANLPGKIGKDIWAYGLQLIEPSGNPIAWQIPGSELAGWMLAQLDEDGSDRLKHLRSRLKSQLPDADTTSLGLLLPLYFVLGILCAFFRIKKDLLAWIVLVLGGGVMLFFMVFVMWHQWSYYAGRFFILVVPMMALIGGYFFHSIGRSRMQTILLVLTAGWSFAFVYKVYTQAYHTGFSILRKELTQPAQLISVGETYLVESMPGIGDGILAVAMPREAIQSGWYRIPSGPKIRHFAVGEVQAFPTAAAFLQALQVDGITGLVAPLELFQDRLGEVKVHVFQNIAKPPLDVKYLLYALPPDNSASFLAPFFIIEELEYLNNSTVETYQLFNRKAGLVRVEIRNSSPADHQLRLPNSQEDPILIPAGATGSVDLEVAAVQRLTFESWALSGTDRVPPDPDFEVVFPEAAPLIHPFLRSN